jgi:hypothetical protein
MYISADTIFMGPSKNFPESIDRKGFYWILNSLLLLMLYIYLQLRAHYLWEAGRNVHSQQN